MDAVDRLAMRLARLRSDLDGPASRRRVIQRLGKYAIGGVASACLAQVDSGEMSASHCAFRGGGNTDVWRQVRATALYCRQGPYTDCPVLHTFLCGDWVHAYQYTNNGTSVTNQCCPAIHDATWYLVPYNPYYYCWISRAYTSFHNCWCCGDSLVENTPVG